MRDDAAREASRVLKDALYVSVGLGVLAFQKAQVQRQELRKLIEERLATPPRTPTGGSGRS